jgi:hypothetical protein
MSQLACWKILLQLVNLIIKFLQFHDFIKTVRTLSMKILFKSIFFLGKKLNFSLLCQNFFRIWKGVSFSEFSFWISILNIMNDKASIFTACKKLVVVVTNSHSLNSFRVSLNFIDLVHLQ